MNVIETARLQKALASEFKKLREDEVALIEGIGHDAFGLTAGRPVNNGHIGRQRRKTL